MFFLRFASGSWCSFVASLRLCICSYWLWSLLAGIGGWFHGSCWAIMGNMGVGVKTFLAKGRMLQNYCTMGVLRVCLGAPLCRRNKRCSRIPPKFFQVWRLVKEMQERFGASTRKVDVYTYTQGVGVLDFDKNIHDFLPPFSSFPFGGVIYFLLKNGGFCSLSC